MKKMLFLIFFVSALSLCYGQQKIAVETPVATVKYITTKNFYKADVKKEADLFYRTFGKKPTLDDLKTLVDGQINQELLTQEFKNMGLKVESQEVDKAIEQQKMQITGGQPITDSEFRSMMYEQTGITYDEYRKNIEFAILQQRYIEKKFPDLYTNIKKPTPAEIEDFYNSNANYFLAPAMVRYEQIYFDTTKASSSQKKEYKAKIDGMYAKIKTGGKATFDKYVTDSLSDPTYQGGDAGIVQLTSQYEQAISENIGQTFLDALKKLQPGQFSNVIESKVGYHIIYVTDKTKPKLLTLSDAIAPGQSITVSQYIEQYLLSKKQQELFMGKINDLVKSTRAKATITINENELKSLL